MKRSFSLMLTLSLIFSLAACGQETEIPAYDGVQIKLSDEAITVDGKAIGTDGAVYAAHDIVYYEDGHDFTYGEGEA